MRFISSLVLMYVRIMNEASRKLTQKSILSLKFRGLVTLNRLNYLLFFQFTTEFIVTGSVIISLA